MKYLILCAFLLTSNFCFSQTTFFGCEIIFDRPNPKIVSTTQDSALYFIEPHFYFDEVVQYYNEGAYMFSSNNPTGLIYKKVYDELVYMFGTEDVIDDYIPHDYKDGLTYEKLIELCLSKQAEIYRSWRSRSDFDVSFSVIPAGLSVLIEKK